VQNDPASAGTALWMTLIDSVRYIQSKRAVSSVYAQFALKQRIAANEITVKWADARGPRDVPNIQWLTRSQFVLYKEGYASDGRSSLRRLIVLRSALIDAVAPELTILKHFLSNSRKKEKFSVTEWMTLVETTERVQISQNCDSVQALRRIKQEIADGTLVVQWADSENGTDCPDPKRLIASQFWLLGTGLAVDEKEETYRPLLIERSTVQKLWPLSDWSPRAEASNATAESKSAVIVRKRGSPEAGEEIRVALNEVYQEAINKGSKPPNMAEAERKLRLKLPNARRPLIRAILHEPSLLNFAVVVASASIKKTLANLAANLARPRRQS
jgi:hypothetical protein